MIFFRVPRETYGKDVTHTSLINVNQAPEESVKVYFAHLKLNFKKAGFYNGLKGLYLVILFMVSDQILEKNFKRFGHPE